MIIQSSNPNPDLPAALSRNAYTAATGVTVLGCSIKYSLAVCLKRTHWIFIETCPCRDDLEWWCRQLPSHINQRAGNPPRFLFLPITSFSTPSLKYLIKSHHFYQCCCCLCLDSVPCLDHHNDVSVCLSAFGLSPSSATFRMMSK